MCMSTIPAEVPDTSSSIPIAVAAVTSLTRSAPAASAASATSTLDVSTDRTRPGNLDRSSVMTGTTRRSSSDASTGSAPGRVDSPPTSMMSTPPATSSSAWRRASSSSKQRLPSEKESGVRLRMPMTTGRGRGHSPSIRFGSGGVPASRRAADGEVCRLGFNSCFLGPHSEFRLPNSEFSITPIPPPASRHGPFAS